MNHIYLQYLDNVKECYRLSKTGRFPASEPEGVILEKISENARSAYRLRLENDAILDQVVFSRTADTLTPEDVQELQDFASALLTFAHQYDAGIAYKIHSLLFEYAKLHDDLDLYLRELYHMGISLYYISPAAGEFGINLNGKTSNTYLREGASYLARLEEIESEETRAYVIRCLANLYLTEESINGVHAPGKPVNRVEGYPCFRELFAKIRGVLDSPYYRALVPCFDWDNAVHSLHFNRCLYFMRFRRSDLPHMVEDMMESAEYIYTHRKSAEDHSAKGARIDYLYASALYMDGQVELTHIVDVLLASIAHADLDDYSLNGVMLNLQLPLYLEYTNRLLTDAQRASYGDRIQTVLDRILLYLKKVPFNAYSNVVNEIVAGTIRHYVQTDEPLSKRLFDYLLCCHTPTYIHVQLVAVLARMLFLRMAETVPHKLIGLFGITDPERITEQKEALADRVYDCALYHDVGKILLLNYIEIYNRSLLPEEYSAICLHPHIGAQILETLEQKEVSCAALYHHSFFDQSSGYPKDLPPCPPAYKPIVDLLAVSDSLEAATDNVGRCYAAPKSFETIVDELRRGCPTRYSPDVVALFDDRDFFDRVRETLAEGRRRTYLELYREPRSESDQ